MSCCLEYKLEEREIFLYIYIYIYIAKGDLEHQKCQYNVGFIDIGVTNVAVAAVP